MKLTSIIAAITLSATSAFAWEVEDLNDHIEQTNFIVGNHCSGTLISVEHRLILTNEHCTNKYVRARTEKVVNEKGVVSDVRMQYFDDVPVSQKVYKDHKLVSQSSYIGDLVDFEAETDLSLIQLRIENLPHTREAEFFTGDRVYRGEVAYAIGNPMMLDASVTKGIVSNVNRLIQVGRDERAYYQMDAGIVGGSSGGSLYNNDGLLIGVPAAAARGTSVGLSIPYTVVQRFLKDNCYEELWNDEAQSFEQCVEEKKEEEEE